MGLNASMQFNAVSMEYSAKASAGKMPDQPAILPTP